MFSLGPLTSIGSTFVAGMALVHLVCIISHDELARLVNSLFVPLPLSYGVLFNIRSSGI